MYQSPAVMIETPEIATPVCALVRNDTILEDSNGFLNQYKK